MSDQDTGAAQAQAAEATQPQAGTDSPAQAAGAQAAQAAGAADGSGTGPDLAAEVAALRKEAAAARTRLKAFEKAEQDRKDADLSDLQKAQTRIAELEQEREAWTLQQQESRLRMASLSAAQKLGFREPDLAFRLLDQGAVQYAEDGTPRNVEQLLTALAKASPYLVTAADFGGGTRGQPASGAGMNEIIRRAAGIR